MLKYLPTILFCLLNFTSRAQTQKTQLSEDYYFIMTDCEVSKFHQSNDTLYEYKCYCNKLCYEKAKWHYKIYSINQSSNKIILKLERLDTIQLAKNPFPENRFSILVLKQETKDRITLVQQLLGLNKEDITSNFVDSFKTENKFGFTYFSQTQYDKFSQLKTIKKKDEVVLLLQKLKTEKYTNITKQYESSHIMDMYGAGLSAELLNQVCIDNGFNPIGAGLIINKLMKE